MEMWAQKMRDNNKTARALLIPLVLHLFDRASGTFLGKKATGPTAPAAPARPTEPRRCLLLLGHQNVNTYTWTSVRSGRATEMAASGFVPGQVLDPGEQVQTICNCCAQHLTRVTMNEGR